jgi:hypothetical protein
MLLLLTLIATATATSGAFGSSCSHEQQFAALPESVDSSMLLFELESATCCGCSCRRFSGF